MRTAERLDLARLANHGALVIERRPPRVAFGEALVTLPPGGFLQATEAGEERLAAIRRRGVQGREEGRRPLLRRGRLRAAPRPPARGLRRRFRRRRHPRARARGDRPSPGCARSSPRRAISSAARCAPRSSPRSTAPCSIRRAPGRRRRRASSPRARCRSSSPSRATRRLSPATRASSSTAASAWRPSRRLTSSAFRPMSKSPPSFAARAQSRADGGCSVEFRSRRRASSARGHRRRAPRADRPGPVRRRAGRAARPLSGKGARPRSPRLDRGSRGRRGLLQRGADRNRAAGRQHRARRRPDAGRQRRRDHPLDPAAEGDPRGRPARRRDDLRSGRDARRGAGRSARGRPAVSAVARGRGNLHHRRQRLDQRRRPDGHRLWQCARSRHRRRGGPGRRADRQRAEQAAQGQHRL